MIQRIQTVYLFVGALVLAAFGFFEMPWVSEAAATYVWFVPSLVGLLILTAAGALGAIFLYENRETQRSVVVAVQGDATEIGVRSFARCLPPCSGIGRRFPSGPRPCCWRG